MITMLALLLFAAAGAAAALIYRKNMQQWLPAYISRSLAPRHRPGRDEPMHVVVCIVDHFEPEWNSASSELEAERVDRWVREYPLIADRHRDAEGRRPQYSFFYPIEHYRRDHLEKLARLCKAGYGDVEIHLHHDHDTADGLRSKLEKGRDTLFNDHGLLRKDSRGNIVYGFIHGNWALDNSRRDGRWCGVNNELQVLARTGCYADFTFPSAPDATQPAKINSIYYAADDPARPKSHDSGTDVRRGGSPSGDLMIIQGPLALNWGKRKWGVVPRIENAEITGSNPPTRERVALWIRQRIGVVGAPGYVFVKLHTHGCEERNSSLLLGSGLETLFAELEDYCRAQGHVLHYATAWECHQLIKKLESSPDKAGH